MSRQTRAPNGSVPDNGRQPSVNALVSLPPVYVVTVMWTLTAERLPPPQPPTTTATAAAASATFSERDTAAVAGVRAPRA